jgi:ferrous iron transport protein A
MKKEQPVFMLDRVKNGKYKVVSIEGGTGLVRKLTDLGVYPGSMLEVLSGYHRGGPIVLSVKGSRFGIGRGMASRIVVKRVD